MVVSGQHHALAALSLGRNSCTHCIGGWVVLRAGLYDLEQNKNVIPVPGVEPWIVQHLALSLYRRPACALKMSVYRGADKSLARPGRKKATATKL